MKRLLILFGILDGVTLIRSYHNIISLVNMGGSIRMLVINLLLYTSLALSCFYLVRQRRAGIWITYLQFPFRLLYMVLSFGFLFTINSYLKFTDEGSMPLMLVVFGLEFVRLVFTIIIHRKYFRT